MRSCTRGESPGRTPKVLPPASTCFLKGVEMEMAIVRDALLYSSRRMASLAASEKPGSRGTHSLSADCAVNWAFGGSGGRALLFFGGERDSNALGGGRRGLSLHSLPITYCCVSSYALSICLTSSSLSCAFCPAFFLSFCFCTSSFIRMYSIFFSLSALIFSILSFLFSCKSFAVEACIVSPLHSSIPSSSTSSTSSSSSLLLSLSSYKEKVLTDSLGESGSEGDARPSEAR
mmetsp:Transcript_34215/g.88367  ORF Transcript_34215/g.88367 Transcript_34215/m.88367 type:complete len:232 (-) Transcript_34215:1648-2343(-)